MKRLNGILSVGVMASVFFLFSCGNDKESSKSAAVNASGNNATKHISADFYKRLEGTIANQPVVMYLQSYGGNISGTYYYVSQGRPITLNGTLDSLHPDNFQLSEFNQAYSEEDNASPKLDCVYEAGQIKGSWRSGDGSKNYLIDLKETYPEGGIKFAALSLKQEQKAIPNSDSSPVATVTKQLLIPENDKTDNAWLSNQIVKIIGEDTISGSFDIVDRAKKSNEAFAKSYTEEVNEDSGERLAFPESLGYEDLSSLSVLYNENAFLIIDNEFYSYTGGAHGFGGNNYYCFDMQNKKKLKLNDMLSADSSQLQPILEATFRKDRGLSPTDSLSEVLFENHLSVADNFYFTSKGIGFVYLPYEIASYADGSILIFVPYTHLRKYIQPAFAKRMKL